MLRAGAVLQPPPALPTSNWGAEMADTRDSTNAAVQQPDPLEWVRVAIDGLRHAQNILLGSTVTGFAMLLAMMGFMLTELGGDVKGLGDAMRAMEQRIIARIDTLDAKLTDTRERVIRLEEIERKLEPPPLPGFRP
jgi:hypothetical protein